MVRFMNVTVVILFVGLAATAPVGKRETVHAVTGTVATGGVPGGSIPSKIMQGITTLFGGRDVDPELADIFARETITHVDGNVEATGGVPGGSIPSKIMQGITTLFGARDVDPELATSVDPRCKCPPTIICGCGITQEDIFGPLPSPLTKDLLDAN